MVSTLNKCHFGINQELVNIFILQAEVFRETNEIKWEEQACHISPSLRQRARCTIGRTQWLISDCVNIVFFLPEKHTGSGTCDWDVMCVAVKRTEFEFVFDI